MKALLWKDARINLPIIIIAIVSCTLPALIGGVLLWRWTWPAFPKGTDWAEMLRVAAGVGFAMSQIVIALLGANAIAAERVDRSAEFLFSLPPSRRRILVSKFLVSLATVVAMWVTVLLMVDVVCVALEGNPQREMRGPVSRDFIVAISVFLFSTAWLGSSYLSSTTYALGASLVLLAGLSMGLGYSSAYFDWPPPLSTKAGERWFIGIYAGLGALAFAEGCRYYLRRVEP